MPKQGIVVQMCYPALRRVWKEEWYSRPPASETKGGKWSRRKKGGQGSKEGVMGPKFSFGKLLHLPNHCCLYSCFVLAGLGHLFLPHMTVLEFVGNKIIPLLLSPLPPEPLTCGESPVSPKWLQLKWLPQITCLTLTFKSSQKGSKCTFSAFLTDLSNKYSIRSLKLGIEEN